MKLMKIAALLIGLSVTAEAHHSAMEHYDISKFVVLDATITKVAFVNPHAYVYFKSQGKDWRCELMSRTALSRLGWTADTFPPGHKVTIKGAPARREDNVCMLMSFVNEDGREIRHNEPLAPHKTKKRATGRAVRLADGRPNLQGPWLVIGGPDGRPPGPRRGGPGPGRTEPTPDGQLAAKNYDQRFDDPAIQCNPANIIFGWVHDRHVNEITQKPDTITLKYGYMDFVRTIHVGLAEHPKNIKPSLGGHSIGRWEGDVLVVDTVGFQPGLLVPLFGVMHSAQMHVIERFSLDANAKTLTRTYRAEDPLYLKSPYTGTDTMALSDEPYTPYECVELSGKNNVR